MHELGVVFYVIRDVKEVAEKNRIPKVNSVTLQIGEVSGIVRDLLTDCWNWARKKEPVTADAELKIEQIDAVTFCEDCHEEYPTVQYGKTCPHCGSKNTYLITGNEFMIKQIEVDGDPPDGFEDSSPDTDSSPSSTEDAGGIERTLSSGLDSSSSET